MKETFAKIEEIILRQGRTSESIPDLKDIVMDETEGNAKNPTGFKHDPASYSVSFHNGSKIMTLNSKPDNVRGKRANLIVYDEAAFVDDELITATIPFVSQDASAKYGKDAAKEKDTITRQPYNQIIMASSQNTIDCMFYREYKQCAMDMIAGRRDVFVADMPCYTAMTMYHKGEEIPALLSKAVVDSEMKKNADKARREYYNKPDLTGGDNQIIKWSTVRHNEKQIIPTLDFTGNKIILAFDPARTGDNSILGAMEIIDDPEIGICGNIISCTNFVDTVSSKKLKLDSNRQLAEIRNLITRYNGENPDYEFIDSIMLDAGSGGGGVSTYADGLLNNWNDSTGKEHKGLIDLTHEIYIDYRGRYPDAVNKIRLINPRKYRTQMIEEAIELMELGVVKFPYQYNGQDFISVTDGVDLKTGEEIMKTYYLSPEEIVNFEQIELMKNEICTFRKTQNGEGMNVQYQLAIEKRNIMHRQLCQHRIIHNLCLKIQPD